MNDRDLVFHGLAIKRHAGLSAIAEHVGLSRVLVGQVLATAAATGRAIEVQGGFALTPLARVALEARYHLHFAAVRQNPNFKSAYETFERINVSLKQVITDWQTLSVGGTKIANDHRDEAHDATVIDRLGAVHEQVEPVLAQFACVLPRMAIYEKKLLAALEAAEDGDGEWVSDIRRESYHTIWFELHEDLLRIMGQVRVG
jgi:hypothetical protein